MPLFLITSVCDEGVSANSFKVVEAESRLSIARHILDRPHDWEQFLRSTKLWWDLTYYPYKYGEPRGWTPADLLARIDARTSTAIANTNFEIHEITVIERLHGERAAGAGESGSDRGPSGKPATVLSVGRRGRSCGLAIDRTQRANVRRVEGRCRDGAMLGQLIAWGGVLKGLRTGGAVR